MDLQEIYNQRFQIEIDNQFKELQMEMKRILYTIGKGVNWPKKYKRQPEWV